MIEYFAPRWFYQGSVSKEGQSSIRESFGDFIKDDNNFQSPEVWNCNVKSSFGVESNLSAPFNKFTEYINANIDQFTQELGVLSRVDIIPQEFWINRYGKGHFQEYHSHGVFEVNLSLVYFYQLDDINKSDFTFYNTRQGDYKQCGLADIFNLPSALEVNPIVSEGDIIIFPAFYPHLVRANKSDKERITISSNLFAIPLR